METIHKQFYENTKSVLPTTGPRQKWLTMATETPDRCGDVMVLAGMNAENFKKNPQFIWQHGYSGATVNTIGKILDLQVMGGSLFALAEFATAEVSPLAEEIYQLAMAGLLPANSIGFKAIESTKNDTGGYTYTKWELIECSKVELPMNAEAIDKSLLHKTNIELDELAMIEAKSGRAISSDRDKKFREHANTLRGMAKDIEDMLDEAAPKSKEEESPVPLPKTLSTEGSEPAKISTRRLHNRASLSLKKYQDG